MSEKLREAVSAAVDGEASEFELRRVLDEMGKDESLWRAWQSYHLIGQAARGENVEAVAEMGERIWASLDAEEFLEQDIVQEEPAYAVTPSAPRRRWGLAGGALAAALSVAVVMSSDLLDSDLESQPSPTPAEVVKNTATPSSAGAQLVADASNTSDASVAPEESRPSGDARALQVAATSGQTPDNDFDYGPGFVPYSELSAADQARTDGYFLYHVQHQAVNNDNLLSFVKMISYPQ